MYSWEIEEYLKERNYYLTSDEIIYVTNIELHPQLARIRYNNEFDFYEMWTSDNYYFKFGCKSFVKVLKR